MCAVSRSSARRRTHSGASWVTRSNCSWLAIACCANPSRTPRLKSSTRTSSSRISLRPFLASSASLRDGQGPPSTLDARITVAQARRRIVALQGEFRRKLPRRQPMLPWSEEDPRLAFAGCGDGLAVAGSGDIVAAARGDGFLEPGLGGFRDHELGARQLGKVAALAHQFVEAPALDDAAGLEHQNAGRVANGGEAMRDHESGTALHDLVKCGLHLGLGERIERARRFVENEDRRVLEECAGN